MDKRYKTKYKKYKKLYSKPKPGSEKVYKAIKRNARKSGQEYSFVRYCEDVLEWSYGDTGSGLNVFGYGLSIALTDLQNYSELTALFDQYKIDKVIFHFLPSWNNGEVLQLGAGVTLPWIFYYADYDDDTAPTSLSFPYQRQSLKFKLFDSPFKVSVNVKPTTALLLSSTDPVPALGDIKSGTDFSKKAAWCDMTHPDITHYGLKVVLDQSGSKTVSGELSGPIIKVIKEVHFRCRGVR